MHTGGHINPAISLAFLLAKKISAQRFLCYVVAQLVGAILGSAFVYAVRVAPVHVTDVVLVLCVQQRT